MKKQHILDEIRRTAQENGGIPLGRERFERDTGIKESDWSGRFWIRWSEAVREAGFEPNTLNAAYEDSFLLEKYAQLVRDLGRVPVQGELIMKRRNDPEFPSETVYRRFGNKSQLLQKVAAYCLGNPAYEGVAGLLPSDEADSEGEASQADELEVGYVYLALMKVGREKRYKIGKADIVGRRTRQVAVDLPEDLELVHVISTDDAYGIEGYWHKRFAAKRRMVRSVRRRSEGVQASKVHVKKAPQRSPRR